MAKIAFRDRLRDRGFIDQWGFIAFAVAGFIGIFLAKYIGAGTGWVALGAVIAMVIYAAVIGRAGTGRIRADQAGDNCYYLGLIYTLASLSFAIASFDPNDTASTIVQGFGIALATTIFGLILRVFFSQGRPDLENHEEELRLELTEAVSRLKGELNGVVMSMNDFSRRFQQSTEEMHTSAAASIEKFTASSVEGLSTVVEEAAEAIRSEANDFAARSKKYSTTFNNLVAKLERHGATVDRMSEAHDALSNSVTVSASAAGSANEAVELLVKGARIANGTASAVKVSAEMTQELMVKLAETVGSVQDSLQRFREETDRRLEEIANMPSAVAQNAMDALAEASASLKRNIADAEKVHRDINANLVAQSEASLALSKRHNGELEAELERSRRLVEKVHYSLADMTGNLAKAVENAP